MDKIDKLLKKFSSKEKQQIKSILEKINSGKLQSLDLKKLKGYKDIFRIRKGDIRVIYRLDDENRISILAIERRSDKTYNL
ncbi:MAG: hypothetical protein COU10_04000 [Candidatus Harrisonbacteria bacterium CG10_big_fil_rev_8_21_14_0_10_45_28]|uniref:Type II toxin-antitoxin system mRNA interferase toxin, RelE/StbE family n=1 Tax=Candidatus Harrisonbacteria bacterium CG10_big_fil_rev_8_21_14_0_10_45_28 TaxID=1974586 RepID=A0A2H0UM99_9BACT|nr:MAG: hypothetical protein COU10_04000 [Candidatus Harrisonbacteria bacterium CG10_big_fil_rev_8_21_14_0_10_45_28]